MTRYQVHYIHTVLRTGERYWVYRAFDTREAAQEFIDVNAMVAPLPGPAHIEEVTW